MVGRTTKKAGRKRSAGARKRRKDAPGETKRPTGARKRGKDAPGETKRPTGARKRRKDAPGETKRRKLEGKKVGAKKGEKKPAADAAGLNFKNGKLPPVLGGNGEFLASVTTAGGENAAAVGGTHALTEAVLVDALAVRRLECSFHISIFIYFRQ